MSQVTSSVYGTPIITDLFSDNKKEIIVPSHVHYLEALEAEDGAAAVGWPVFHKSHLSGSPFLVDIDRDGILEIGVGTFNGEIKFYSHKVKKMEYDNKKRILGHQTVAYDVHSAFETQKKLVRGTRSRSHGSLSYGCRNVQGIVSLSSHRYPF